jgi:hypothetical protein
MSNLKVLMSRIVFWFFPNIDFNTKCYKLDLDYSADQPSTKISDIPQSNLQSELVTRKTISHQTKKSSEQSGSLKFTIKGKKISRDLQRWNSSRQTLESELEIERIDKELQDDLPVKSCYNVFNFAWLSCLLCQRKFKNTAHLKKHMIESSLHRSNLSLDSDIKNRLIEESCVKCNIPLTYSDESTSKPAEVLKKSAARKR